ncbi:MAG: T9SS type A sorting domain-containing protein [Candidatus Aegiribacteria sp.]|nr:T9SS type A sorting domain-containing protein [Candidatus Aegiribacteria sp.]
MKVVLSIILAVSMFATAGELTFSYDISLDDVEMATFEGYDFPLIVNGFTTFDDGYPNLPAVPYSFVLPQGTDLVDVTVEIHEIQTIEGNWDIDPVRTCRLNETPGPRIFNPIVYGSDNVFPSEAALFMQTGNKTGFRVGSFSFVPFQYKPLSRELNVITSASITVTYIEDASVRMLSLTDEQITIAGNGLRNIVLNSEMLDQWAPSLNTGTDGASWLVLADPIYETMLEPLVAHRDITTGCADYVSLDWIYANYTGYDTQEQIRNYLIDRFENHGLIYVLIVGDYGPTTRISDLTLSGQHLDSVTDLYYSDLDGTWDNDGDHQYGEYSDGLDYYSDIYVGRFSSEVDYRIEAMINRTLAYEQTPTAGDWNKTALLIGALLWPPYGGQILCDTIAKRIPGDWTIHKLYETGSGHPTNQIDLLNAGVVFCEPTGHGYTNGIYWYNNPDNMITNYNYTDLTNIDMLTVFSSITCLAGKISVGCIAEKLMYLSTGGAIAVMFNSDNGWGSPPNMGVSETLEVCISDQLFTNVQQELGVMHSLAKDQLRAGPHINFEEWVLQEHNLLGDPALLFSPGYYGIEDGPEIDILLPSLSAPTPNPSAGNCSIAFDMPYAGNAEITVYDLSGRTVATVLSGTLNAGSGSVAFDGRDNSGNQLPSGCYTVVLTGTAGTAASRMIIVR